MTVRPFQDLLITDISGTVAIFYVGKLFVDYGTRVVNLEPSAGFGTKSLGPFREGGNSATAHISRRLSFG